MNKFLFAISVVLLCGVFSFAQQSRPLKILAKPYPLLPQNPGNHCSQGTIVVRVEFQADGRIGKVFPIITLPSVSTDEVVKAARQIKFELSIKSGVAVTIYRQVQYFYQWGGWIPRPEPLMKTKIKTKEN